MNKPAHLHKLYILFPLVSIFKSLAPAWILIGIQLLRGRPLEQLPWNWIAIGVLAVVLLAIVFGYFQWKRFTYQLEDSRMVIRRGVLFRDERSLYTGRIHSMNIEQPLLQRMLGIMQVRIETPGKKDDGSVLPAVSGHAAELLQKWLRERTQTASTGLAGAHYKTKSEDQTEDDTDPAAVSMPASSSGPVPHADAGIPAGSAVQPDVGPDSGQQSNAASDQISPGELSGSSSQSHDQEVSRHTLMQLSNGKLLTAALTSPNLSLAVAFIGGLISFADNLLPDWMYDTLLQSAGGLSYGSWIIVIIFALTLTWLLSGLLYTLKYAGFTVEQIERQIAVSCGLLEKKRVLFSPERVLAVTVKEGVIRRWFGYAEVRLHVLTSSEDKTFMLHPLLKKDEIPALLGNVVPQFEAHPITASPPRRALWMYLVWKLVAASAAIAASLSYFGLPGLWSLLLLPLAVLWGMLAHRDAGMNLTGKQLTIRSRFIALSTRYMRRQHIVSLKASASRMQRRKALLSMKVNMFSSEASESLRGMDQQHIEAVWRWYEPGSHARRSSAELQEKSITE